MKPNPPVKGHGLLFEGGSLYHPRPGKHAGGCQCGAKPEGFPGLSTREMKAWHREHKAGLRGELPASLNENLAWLAERGDRGIQSPVHLAGGPGEWECRFIPPQPPYRPPVKLSGPTPESAVRAVVDAVREAPADV